MEWYVCPDCQEKIIVGQRGGNYIRCHLYVESPQSPTVPDDDNRKEADE